jgi:predicted ArsR family transcriptional regulator
MADADQEDRFIDQAGIRSRELHDPRSMRALAHPRRLDLLELLFREGPLTATECGERLGDSPASCSYHLRQLARYGFVEEADGGTGRQRPWRTVKAGLTLRSDLEPMSAAQQAASRLLEDVIDDRRAAKLAAWHRHRDRAPAAWREVAGESDFGFWATPAEVAEINERLLQVLAPYQQRMFDSQRPDTPDTELVTYLVYAFPDLRTEQPDA